MFSNTEPVFTSNKLNACGVEPELSLSMKATLRTATAGVLELMIWMA